MKQPGLRRGDAGNGGGLAALTTVNRPWPTNGASILAARISPVGQRVARRWPAVCRGGDPLYRLKAIDPR
jgi:hypothetical protein